MILGRSLKDIWIRIDQIFIPFFWRLQNKRHRPFVKAQKRRLENEPVKMFESGRLVTQLIKGMIRKRS